MKCPVCEGTALVDICKNCGRPVFPVAFKDKDDLAFITRLAVQDETDITTEIVNLIKWVRETYDLPIPVVEAPKKEARHGHQGKETNL